MYLGLSNTETISKVDRDKILNSIRTALLTRGESVAVAESVTAGNLQAALSLAEQAMAFFQGGVTAYNLVQKATHLGVDPLDAERCNCVSGNIASVMAESVMQTFNCEWGIGITGYAAPVPEWGVGDEVFAYYAFAYKGECVLLEKIQTRASEMEKVQRYYVLHVLENFARFVTDRSKRNLK